MLAAFLFLILVISLLFRKWKSNRKYSHLRGPSAWLSLPSLGHAYLLGDQPERVMMEVHRKYGAVVRFDLGDAPTVMIGKAQLLKEAFSKDAMSGRWWNQMPTLTTAFPTASDGSKILSPTFSEGPVWAEQRKFMLRNLSEIGMGNVDAMNAIIEEESEEINRRLRSKEGQPINSKNQFMAATNNVIWRFTTNKRSGQGDPLIAEVTSTIQDIIESIDPSNVLTALQLNNYPLARACNFLGLPNILSSKGTSRLRATLAGEIRKHSPKQNGSYIERALWESQVGRGLFASEHGEEYLNGQVSDLFIAGTDSTSTTLEWCILYLLKFPETQQFLHDEIASLTGEGTRPISLTDRPNAHLTNSFIDEVFRHCPMIFFPPGHKTLEDTVVGGVLIPKGTQVNYSNYALNHDESVFERPLEFVPDRFLTADGTFHRDERVMVFGVGKRRCPGEALARAEIFLFLTRLVQTFRISSPVKPDDLTLEGRHAGLVYPQPFHYVLHAR